MILFAINLNEVDKETANYSPKKDKKNVRKRQELMHVLMS